MGSGGRRGGPNSSHGWWCRSWISQGAAATRRRKPPPTWLPKQLFSGWAVGLHCQYHSLWYSQAEPGSQQNSGSEAFAP
jgi:hypothetical protein